MPVKVDSTTVTLTCGQASAVVALHGATVVSYKANGREQIWVSKKSDLAGPAPIRGGIPICWPVFGPPKDEPKFNKMQLHGLARLQKWSFEQERSSDEAEKAVAVFTLESNAETQSVYASAFKLTYKVALSAEHLTCTLQVESPSSASSSEPVEFQAGLHTYFRVPEGVKPPTVGAKGLRGLEILDKVGPDAPQTKKEDRELALVDGPDGYVDRVYFGVPSELEIHFGNEKHEKIVMTSTGFPDAVLLNHGPKNGAKVPDIHEGGWDEYVCLENVRIRDWVKLAPGQSWEGSSTIQPTSD